MKTELVVLTPQLLSKLDETDSFQNVLRLRGIAFALLIDGEVMAAGGIARLWGNVGKAWTIHVKKAEQSAFVMRQIHKHVKREFPIIRAAMGLERVEAETESARPNHCAWLERFGFKLEGEMPKYRDGVTFARYGWIL